MKYKYDLGIIGGMGSEATVEIFSRIINRCFHTCDQDSMRIAILNDSKIPDRTKYILEGGENPLPYLNSAIRDLKKIKAKYFIIDCNTAHYFAEDLKYKGIEFISLIEESLKYIIKNHKDKKICILGTNGLINSGVYFNNKFAKDLDFIKLDQDSQKKVMNVVTFTKEDRDKSEILKLLKEAMNSINDDNVLYVLACTEISLYKNDLKEYNIIDSMDVLVDEAIIKCGYKLKD